MTFLFIIPTLKCTFIRRALLFFASSLRLPPSVSPSGIAHDWTVNSNHSVKRAASPPSSRSFTHTVRCRQRRAAQAVCQRAQGSRREQLSQTPGPDSVRAQHPSVLLTGRYSPCSRKANSLAQIPLHTSQGRAHPYPCLVSCVSGCRQRVVLAVWHCSVGGVERPPGLATRFWTQPVQVLQTRWKTGGLSLQPTLCAKSHSGLFQWNGSSFPFPVCSHPQCFKVGYIVFCASSSLTAAKSHPHDVPLVVSTEKHPVNTGVQSEWHYSGPFTFFLLCLFLNTICGSFVWLCVHLQSCQTPSSTAALYLARVDPEVQGVFYSNGKTTGARWLLHGGLRQAKRTGETFPGRAHTHTRLLERHVTSALRHLCDRRRRSRRRRQSSKRRMKRAGQRSQKDQRVPRPAPTARQPTGGHYRKRWRRRRGRSSWTSTPGSTKIHRKNVSVSFIHLPTLWSQHDNKNLTKCFFPPPRQILLS